MFWKLNLLVQLSIDDLSSPIPSIGLPNYWNNSWCEIMIYQNIISPRNQYEKKLRFPLGASLIKMLLFVILLLLMFLLEMFSNITI